MAVKSQLTCHTHTDFIRPQFFFCAGIIPKKFFAASQGIGRPERHRLFREKTNHQDLLCSQLPLIDKEPGASPVALLKDAVPDQRPLAASQKLRGQI